MANHLKTELIRPSEYWTCSVFEPPLYTQRDYGINVSIMSYVEGCDVQGVSEHRKWLHCHVVLRGLVHVQDLVLEHVPHPFPEPTALSLAFQVTTILKKKLLQWGSKNWPFKIRKQSTTVLFYELTYITSFWYLCHPLPFLQYSPFTESCNQLALGVF